MPSVSMPSFDSPSYIPAASTTTSSDTFSAPKITAPNVPPLEVLGNTSYSSSLLDTSNSGSFERVYDLLNSKSALSSLAPQASAKIPSILRFIADGKDLQSACSKIYFSGISSDGSFLLTGDRTYNCASEVCTEIFYMLFSPKDKENNSVYNVTPTVSQTKPDSSSPFYRLSHIKSIRATRTGNFISLCLDAPEIKFDLLLDASALKSGKYE